MRIFSAIRSFTLALVAIAVISSAAFGASGIVVPSGSTLNVNTCTLNVCGDVTNAGTVQTTTGTIALIGNWVNSGTFTSNTGTVTFNSTSGTQTLDTGGLANAFYNLSHNAASTLQLTANPIDINNNFSNTAGAFTTSNLNMNVGKNWTNTATFTPGTTTVTLDGTNQAINGTTTFFNLSKQVVAPDTLTLADTGVSAAGQTITHVLTLRGALGNLLSIRSSTNLTYAKINFVPDATGAQNLKFLNVKDSDASGGTLLIAGGTSTDTGPNPNINWSFANVTLTWDGSASTDWDDPANWNLSVVPSPGDSVIIPAAPANQPVLSTDTNVANATIASGANLTLNGKNLTLTNTLSNDGVINLKGTETVEIQTIDTDSGTFNYTGTGGAGPFALKITDPTTHVILTNEFFNLTINDTSNAGTFLRTANLNVLGALTISGGNLDISTNSKNLTVAGNVAISAGTLTATNGNIDANGAVAISGTGILIAPTTAKSFTIAGNFSHTAGTFTNSSGTVTLDGTNQTLTGSTAFYALNKTVAAAATLTLDSTGIQTIINDLVLSGASGQLLSLRSSVGGVQAGIRLQAGGTQSINYVDVQDSTAAGGLVLIARNSPDHSAIGFNNTNWLFGNTTYTWDGSASTDWNTPANWDIGTVPTTGDTVVIPNVGNQPATLASAASLLNLTIASGAAVSLAGNNLTVTSTLSNDGTITLRGSETVEIATTDINSGTFIYTGTGAATTFNMRITDPTTHVALATEYFNLTVNDASNLGIFQRNANLNVAGVLTISGGNVDISTNTNTLTVTGNTAISAGTLTATNGNIDANGAVAISGTGTLIAPTTAKSFTIAGNFSHAAGSTFTNSSGTVTLDGTNQSLTGNTTFYGLTKTVAAAATLTLDSASIQTATNSLILSGASGQLLSLRSNNAGVQAGIRLQAGGTQAINFVDVQDSTAAGGLLLIARNSPDHSNVSFNNTNWSFGTATYTWDGSASTDWNTQANWDLGIVPSTGDNVIIANVGSQPATLASAVNLFNLTINTGAAMTLVGNNMTVTNALSNDGTITLRGTETVEIKTVDADSGTFIYTGTGAAGPFALQITDPTSHVVLANEFFNLTVNDTSNAGTFRRSANLNVLGALTISGGNLDISTGSRSLSVAGNTAISAGTLTATNGNIDANGAVAISGTGTLIAPTTAKTFTIAGSFSHAAGSTFTNSNGTVTLDTAAIATITGDTTFYNLTSTVAGKEIDFTAGSTQTVNNTLNLVGARGNDIILHSTATGTKWNIAFPNGVQTVSALNVQDSNALTNTVSCLNCNNGGNNNANWIFVSLLITAPDQARTVGVKPVIIGVANANTNVTIKDISNNIVATARSDANGNFRVVTGTDADTDGTTSIGLAQLALGANALTPYIGPNPGLQNDLTVVASPTTSQVPTITSPTNGQRVNGQRPTIIGQGKPSQAVVVYANDAAGNLLLSNVGSGTVDGAGNYSVTLTTSLPKSINYLSVVVDGVSSDLIFVTLTDPFGVVFDSSSNKLIKNATVSIFKSNGTLAQPGVDLAAADTNPYTTGADGFYSFLAASGNYYITVSAFGYTYPSKLTAFPAGRTIITGSKGEGFTVGTTVIEMDHPMDGNGFLLRIEKSANKSEAKIGDVVTYTVKLQNLSADNPVDNVILDDRIPPGFKYLPNRVLLDGAPISDPAGQRPLAFSVGTIPAATTKTLRYQLVIGSGVTTGNYENVAIARYDTGVVISNRATSTVKIMLDPLFDLGTVIGKVFYDLNENGVQDAPEYDAMEGTTIIERPVPNVQIVMEDGTVITADKDGKYSVPGVLPGRHILRLNERTLPPGTFLTTDKAVIVDITPGITAKVNFGVNMDSEQVVGKDAQFFNEQIKMTQDANKPIPRLNAALFDPAQEDKAPEGITMYNAAFLAQVEFRIFTNYAPFVETWHLDIFDKDTKKIVKHFEGGRLNIYDPLFWDGRGDDGKFVRSDHQYSYTLTIVDGKGRRDVTVEKTIKLRLIATEDLYKKEIEQQKDKDAIAARLAKYGQWYIAQDAVNGIELQTIPVQGETVRIDPQGQDIKTVRVLKNGAVFSEVPVGKRSGLTAKELMSGFGNEEKPTPMEVVLPNGDYTLEVIGAKGASPEEGQPAVLSPPIPLTPTSAAPAAAPGTPQASTSIERYTRNVKVGDDYLMFVALGDAKVGYTFNKGNVEPVQSDDHYQGGFWKEGKGAYYLKGKVQGKYLITSSFDTSREQKALFRQLDPNAYYPIYGDKSSINYDATNTQGPLYLLVEWDKSSAIWGNYAIDFKDTEFAAFSRTYYGGKLDYQSVATNPYGDARTKVVVFHAEVQQLPAHNELLGTGGSLYFLKHKEIIQGSDKIRLEVRDNVTGLVVASKDMKNGADYELDDIEGRILFWQPVTMIVKSESIITTDLTQGNPVYVVADYEYAVKDELNQSSEGGRVAQAVGDNVVVGGTYVKEVQADRNYQLKGTDATVHLGSNANVKAEYAETNASASNSFVSTDGGITFTQLSIDNGATGKAYGLSGDARLFDRVGITSYYKWISNDFASTANTSQGGKETAGMALVWDMTPVTRLTIKQDMQKIIQGGNIQTDVQVGAGQTTTTMIQIVHESERLKLTGEYQLNQVKDPITGIETRTNTMGGIVAGGVEYALTDRVKLSLAQQLDITDLTKAVTTAGVAAQVTDRLTLRGQEVFSKQGTATTFGATQNVTDHLALNTDYTVTNAATGEIAKTTTVGVESKVNDKISANASVAMTESNTGGPTMNGSVGARAQINDKTMLDAAIGQTRDVTGFSRNVATVSAATQTQLDKFTAVNTVLKVGGSSDQVGGVTGITKSLSIDAVQTPNEKTSNSTKVQVDEDAVGGKTTTVTFANATKVNDQVQAVSERSIAMNAAGTTQDSKYSLLREQDGKKLEGTLTRQAGQDANNGVTESNIYGLSGDVNDRVALQGSVEKGRVQNLDGTTTNRTAFTFGTGYVLKDTETAVERLTNSAKIELRLDKSVDNVRQFVFYDALQGNITDNFSVSAKYQFDRTEDTTAHTLQAKHHEIVLGTAYRPVNFDRLNLIGQYTYRENTGPTGQIDETNQDVQESRQQVLSAEAVFDVDENWQLSEKFAYRINEEQVAGFDFNRTHTWLMIHRINYRIDRSWQVSGEYRTLTQVEARDSKTGLLLELTRNINDNAQLGIGWNFTQFNDDLTSLNYKSQGPFLRMTGKLYDRTPEEKARARSKWLDERVTEWSWAMVKTELNKPGSKITTELNTMFNMAQQAQKAGHYEEAKQMYKDIIMAGQMMFDEAAEYIRSKIAYEEKLQEYDKSAREYYKNGEYLTARKLWEKIVDDAQSHVVQ